MLCFNTRTYMQSTIFAIVVTATLSKSVYGQSCGVSADLCGSHYGYCGADNNYCAQGCLAASSHFQVADVVTDAFFNGIADRAAANCRGKGFYTRAAFLDALNSYPRFGKVGSVDDSKREIAAFFAHATDLTGEFCYIEAINRPNDCCDKNNTEYPCVSGKTYCGRGPLQLAWNYNYGPAGETIGFDGLNNPEIVGMDRVVSFKTALWYWMNYCHDIITSGQGFGPTISAMSGGCANVNTNMVNILVKYYTNYCKLLGVAPGDNLTCFDSEGVKY